MAETSTIFGFMKYVSATDILSDFKKTVDSHFVNSLKSGIPDFFYLKFRILYFTQKDTTFNIYGIKHILITTYTT